MEIFYSRVKGVLDSLSQSTSRKIALRDETVEFNHLNSPYKSHRTVTVGYGHGIPGMVAISNERFALAAISEGDLSFTGNYMEGALPAFHLRRLFQFPAEAPKWLGGPVQVGIIDTFSHFDEKGRPIFLDSASFSVDYGDYDEGVRRWLIQSFDVRPRVGRFILDIPRGYLSWDEGLRTPEPGKTVFGVEFTFPGTIREFLKLREYLNKRGLTIEWISEIAEICIIKPTS